MHASDAQLLSIRDGEPVTAGLDAHVRDCPGCAARLAQFQALRQRLTDLALPEGPTAATLADALARGRQRRRRRLTTIAAVLAFAIILPAMFWPDRPPSRSATVSTAASERVRVDRLVAQSQALEATLEQIAPRGQVLDGNTAATVASLETSLSTVDARLSSNADASPQLQQALWAQRVTLMQSLVSVRYAADQSHAF